MLFSPEKQGLAQTDQQRNHCLGILLGRGRSTLLNLATYPFGGSRVWRLPCGVLLLQYPPSLHKHASPYITGVRAVSVFSAESQTHYWLMLASVRDVPCHWSCLWFPWTGSQGTAGVRRMSQNVSPGHRPLEVFWVCPSGGRPRGRPRTHCRDYISHLACEHLRFPQEQLQNVYWQKGFLFFLA